MPESLFNKVAGLRPATLFKKRLWHRCFPVNFAKFLKHLFLQNFSGGCFCLKDDWPYNCLSFSCLTWLKICCLFHFNRKKEIEKGKYPDGVEIFTFFPSIDLFDVKDFKRNLTDGNLIGCLCSSTLGPRSLSSALDFHLVGPWSPKILQEQIYE